MTATKSPDINKEYHLRPASFATACETDADNCLGDIVKKKKKFTDIESNGKKSIAVFFAVMIDGDDMLVAMDDDIVKDSVMESNVPDRMAMTFCCGIIITIADNVEG